MRKFWMVNLSVLISLLIAASALAEKVPAILAKVDRSGAAKTTTLKMTQTIITPGGESRTFKILAYSANGNEKSLTVYVAPSQVKGMKILTLNDGDDIWSYFPRTNRTRKLASSARNRKVQGSDFTYDDMSGGKMAEKWTGSQVADVTLDGKSCIRLTLSPTAKGPKSYSKITAWVDKADYTTKRIEYYDLDGEKVKRLDIGGYKKISGVWIPTEYTMTNLLDGGKTIMKVAGAKVNTELDAKLFTEAALAK